MEYSKTFCQNLRYLRKLKGITQEQIAEMLDTDKNTYTQIEENENKTPPEFPILLKLCQLFNISANTLLFCDLKSDEIKHFSKDEIEEIISDIDEALLEVSNIRDYVLNLGENNGR